ncbi:MAG: RNA methyltransferase [Cyanobacteria bacterium J06639_18]
MTVTGVKIILVEPAGHMNVGSVARVMKNFCLNQLVLVNPKCDYLGDEALRMAVHAKDVLQTAEVVNTLPEGLKGCKRAIATTARSRDWEIPLEPPRIALPWLLEEIGQPSALIFGPEDRGLSNEELNYAQRFMRIPTNPEYASLNLATSVGICCYELATISGMFLDSKVDNSEYKVENHYKIQPQIEAKTQENTSDTLKKPLGTLSVDSSEYDIAPLDVVEGYYQQLESVLLTISYLYPHTVASRMEKFRQMYNRAQLRTKEVAMLRGVLRQTLWALSNHELLDISSQANSSQANSSQASERENL